MTGTVSSAVLRSRSATASIEFGLIAPVMGIFLMATVDLSEAIIKYHLLNSTVQQAGLMASQLSIQPDQLSSLTVAQLNEASSVIFAIFPGLANRPTYNVNSNPYPPYAVTISNISFTTTQTGCKAGLDCTSYTAGVTWSAPLKYGQPFYRACGTIAQGAPDDPALKNGTPATVPTSGVVSALTYVLAVDVMYQYTPIFGRFIGPITMRQSGYFNPRSYTATATTLVGVPQSGCSTPTS